MQKTSKHIVAASAVLTAALACTTAHAVVIADFQVITEANYTSDSSINGRAFIGGDLNGSPSIAQSLTQPLGTVGLYVGGNINGTPNVNGDAVVTGTGTVNFNPPFSSGGGQLFNGPIPTDVIPEVSLISDTLADLSANSSVSQSGQTFTFNAAPDANGVAVFDVGEAVLETQNGNLQLNANNADLVVINVAGTAIDQAGGVNINFPNSAGAFVIFNFVDATTLNISSSFRGSIVAPLATVTGDASNVGSLAAFQVDSNGQQTLPSFGFATAPEGPDAEVALV
ncbi:MAG: collagen-binding domain-containing protein, partial [Phycisphaerae bacterium]